MRIPADKIDEVRSATDIVDLIGSFLPLKKRGKNFVGLCPFHNEKTPSFHVSPERQMYHCFGCGVGGNVFTFAMELEKVSFAEAVRLLAEKAGITISQYSSEDEIRASEQEEMYQICREAGLFFYKCLMETTEGKLALEYFHYRGFSDETIRTFGLGYAPNSWDALFNYAKEKKFSFNVLEKAGLLRKREEGTYHDYFRGRAIFPILSTTGRVLGFGARKLREDDPLGKYINSPDTLIYNKSKILYGIFQAKEEIREKDFVILVEGYADLISVFQAGIKNVVASSGTALTQEQIQLVGRYTKNITIMYDADSAGSKAALRSVDLILTNDLDVRVATLPEGDDPDSFVRKKGGKIFLELVDGSISFIDFIAQSYKREGRLISPEGQAQTVRAIVQTIAKMKDELKRNFYVKMVAEKYNLYESILYRELEKVLSVNRLPNENLIRTELHDLQSSEVKAQSAPLEIPPVERGLILAMLEGKTETAKLVYNFLQPDDITNPHIRNIINKIFDFLDEGIEIKTTELVEALPEEQTILSDILIPKNQPSERWKKYKVVIPQATAREIAIDSLLKIKKLAIKKHLEENYNRQKIAGQRGEDTTPYLIYHSQLKSQMCDEIKELELQLKSVST